VVAVRGESFRPPARDGEPARRRQLVDTAEVAVGALARWWFSWFGSAFAKSMIWARRSRSPYLPGTNTSRTAANT